MENQSNKKWMALLGVFAIIMLVYYVGYSGDFNKGSKPTINQAAQLNRIPAGEYRIGKDIPSGEYKIVSDGDLCFYSLSKDSSHASESVISRGYAHGQKYITTQDGQYLEIGDGGHLEKVN